MQKQCQGISQVSDILSMASAPSSSVLWLPCVYPGGSDVYHSTVILFGTSTPPNVLIMICSDGVSSTECFFSTREMLIGVVWVGFSIPIDLVLVTIPLQILKRAKLKDHERRLLKMIFCATLLGTAILYDFCSNFSRKDTDQA